MISLFSGNTNSLSGLQQYDWGKIGSSSIVAQFSHHSNPDIEIQEDKPYAELWMGTHPKVPSYNHDSKVSLRELITNNPNVMLGEEIIKEFGSISELPFLFKVLSIEKVLSIQAHPDKQWARKLHINDPLNYPDDNHKPEMAIAITDFEGFCGFKPLDEIADALKRIPELMDIVGEELSENFVKNIKPNAETDSLDDISNRKLLRAVFTKIMNTSENELVKHTRALISRAHQSPSDFNNSSLPDLLIRLNEQFPDDIGLFCGGLLLNHCVLKAGEAMFLKAKDPHAYISGNIIECMAASDNVVRAGFTPKFKDVKTLVEILTYAYNPVDKQKMQLIPFERSYGDGASTLYNPPIDEFSVIQTVFRDRPGKRHFEGLKGPSILITTSGSGYIQANGVKLKAEPGFSFFIAPNIEIDLFADCTDFTTYRAFVEPK